ncbi:unnamed protein product [Vitrella brassicaformis CCMP3155]|uniref:Uncharacterized protein n=1 Tax=Vitrella brassicaformis (strain CCMP3155) TaxID=1169540 RepID=A0A0G4F900_VITBC|nr:unnamed protein product [Vitrella brassicaformis CCMP3155]|eukprot:CEM09056.1 unnamed protein product [Vitrella brassicaformis CCMP3155]
MATGQPRIRVSTAPAPQQEGASLPERLSAAWGSPADASLATVHQLGLEMPMGGVYEETSVNGFVVGDDLVKHLSQDLEALNLDRVSSYDQPSRKMARFRSRDNPFAHVAPWAMRPSFPPPSLPPPTQAADRPPLPPPPHTDANGLPNGPDSLPRESDHPMMSPPPLLRNGGRDSDLDSDGLRMSSSGPSIEGEGGIARGTTGGSGSLKGVSSIPSQEQPPPVAAAAVAAAEPAPPAAAAAAPLYGQLYDMYQQQPPQGYLPAHPYGPPVYAPLPQYVGGYGVVPQMGGMVFPPPPVADGIGGAAGGGGGAGGVGVGSESDGSDSEERFYQIVSEPVESYLRMDDIPPDAQIPEFYDGISFSLGEAGRELLRYYIRASGHGKKGKTLQNTSIPDLLRMAYETGLWRVAVRLHLEHKGVAPMTPAHAEMRKYKQDQSRRRREKHKAEPTDPVELMRTPSGRPTVAYRDGMTLRLGAEGRRELLRRFRDLYETRKDFLTRVLQQNQIKYSDMRNATLAKILRVAYYAGLWDDVVAIHFDHLNSKSAKDRARRTAREGGNTNSPTTTATTNDHPLPQPQVVAGKPLARTDQPAIPQLGDPHLPQPLPPLVPIKQEPHRRRRRHTTKAAELVSPRAPLPLPLPPPLQQTDAYGQMVGAGADGDYLFTGAAEGWSRFQPPEGPTLDQPYGGGGAANGWGHVSPTNGYAPVIPQAVPPYEYPPLPPYLHPTAGGPLCTCPVHGNVGVGPWHYGSPQLQSQQPLYLPPAPQAAAGAGAHQPPDDGLPPPPPPAAAAHDGNEENGLQNPPPLVSFESIDRMIGPMPSSQDNNEANNLYDPLGSNGGMTMGIGVGLGMGRSESSMDRGVFGSGFGSGDGLSRGVSIKRERSAGGGMGLGLDMGMGNGMAMGDRSVDEGDGIKTEPFGRL